MCARENQKSLSRDFVFPNARVSDAAVPTASPGAIWGPWEYGKQQISGLKTEITSASWLLHLGVMSTWSWGAVPPNSLRHPDHPAEERGFLPAAAADEDPALQPGRA